jgi:hypothetical protein
VAGSNNKNKNKNKNMKKEEVEMAVRESSRRQDRNLQRDKLLEYVPMWQKFVSVLSGHVRK